MSSGGASIDLAGYAGDVGGARHRRLWEIPVSALASFREHWSARLSPATEADARGHTAAGADEPVEVPVVARHGAPAPERDSFDAFFTRHMAPLYGYVRRLIQADDAASDITQETFFRAWTHFEHITGYARPEAWLYRVATNLTMSYLRKRHPVSLSWLGGQRYGGSPAEAAYSADDMEPALAVALSLEDAAAERDLISRVLLELPERQRAVLLLRAVHGFSYAEIAAMLDIAVPNVYQLLSRACKRFRECYEVSANDRRDEKNMGGAR